MPDGSLKQAGFLYGNGSLNFRGFLLYVGSLQICGFLQDSGSLLCYGLLNKYGSLNTLACYSFWLALLHRISCIIDLFRLASNKWVSFMVWLALFLWISAY